MKKSNITVVFGTRPEAIKLCPLILELKSRSELNVRVVTSGQHKELCREVLEFFGIIPDLDLNIMAHGQSLFDITEKIIHEMKNELVKNSPELLLVHGDTTTAFASSLSGFYLGVPIGHVEAGLRSNNAFSPYPEEFNRRAIDAMSFLHFCPTEHAKSNLIFEGYEQSRLFVTGNTVVDALKYTLSGPLPERSDNDVLLLMTVHRRENRGERMRNIFRAVRQASEYFKELRVIFPAHPAKEVKDAIDSELSGSRIELIPPLPLPEFHRLLASCDLILTDSGGIQEEAVSLGKPLLLARDTTERPEGIDCGVIIPVGTDPERIFNAISDALLRSKQDRPHTNPYGLGDASRRIADIILSLRT